MRLFAGGLVGAVLLAAGCAGRIAPPERAVQPGPDPGGAEVEVCLLVAERLTRPLFAGIAGWSGAPWEQVIGSVLVRHPQGLTIIDPAFGQDIARDLRRAPPWFRVVMGDARGKRPLVELLEEVDVDPLHIRHVLLTHAHWDHAGALPDLPRAQLHLAAAEWRFVGSLGRYLEHGTMRHHFEGVGGRVTRFDWTGPPHGSFPASHDVFGDGAVVAVPLTGHTPGSTGFFLRGPGGKRWLLVGDTAWALEGIRRPAHKPGPARALADGNSGQVGLALGHLHALAAAWPQLEIVPAHDHGAMSTISPCRYDGAGLASTGRSTVK
jgi:N-acyl homoserine lactone hydrolase